MEKRSVIFDFNGTLFWDSEINYISWNNCVKRWLNREYTREEFFILNGRTNPETLEKLFERKMDNSIIKKLSKEKNEEYFKVLNQRKEKASLAPGVEKFIIELKKNNIEIAIATSAQREGMEEYEKYFTLSKFFKKENIFSSDEKTQSKPNPEIYLKAIKNMKIDPNYCVVFEDTESGIKSAHCANIANVIGVLSPGSDAKTLMNLKESKFCIDSFLNIEIEKLFK